MCTCMFTCMRMSVNYWVTGSVPAGGCSEGKRVKPLCMKPLTNNEGGCSWITSESMCARRPDKGMELTFDYHD
jgi:hypothetical protein